RRDTSWPARLFSLTRPQRTKEQCVSKFTLVPRNVCRLALVTDKLAVRYALGGVRFILPDDGTYRAEATDGRSLIIVEGEGGDAGKKFASLPTLPAEPAAEAVIPAKAIRKIEKAGFG